jgi:FlaA1/EpsC-like NDP-sugar epimerase
MEHSGGEAIKNNVFGTYNTADMAEKYGCEKFILISTDKAVNPTNIMGASKRMCEMIVQCRKDSETSFAAVRFGNVLGSNGSVIPLFKNQIASGGPVTITDKRIIRYFMTIPEASQLVMEAGAMAKRGELFVLDMGNPAKIYDLAVNMIKLSGYEPDVDIMIKEIGLRPGEKLYEELLIKTEELDKTENNMIFIERESPLSRSEVEDKLSILKDAIIETRGEIASPKIKAAIKKVVPTFRDPGAVNSTADKSSEMKMAENIGDSIICVPNKVSVRITGQENEKGADVVAG